jgi:mRNA interferase RelE/StbE
MKKNVQIEEQVKQFVQSLSPEPRKELRRGLTGLENEEGDIQPLRGDLVGLFRLRVKSYRVIFFHPDCSTIKCVYADRRREVYVKLNILIRGKKILLPSGFHELPHSPSVKPQSPGAAEA